MASYKGFVRLPPIGEVSADGGLKSAGSLVNGVDDFKNQSSQLSPSIEHVQRSPKGKRSAKIKESKKDERLSKILEDFKTVESKNNKDCKQSIEDNSDEIELVKRPDLFNRDSGLDVDSANESAGNGALLQGNARHKKRSHKKKEQATSDRSVNSAAETRVEFLTENSFKSNTGKQEAVNTDKNESDAKKQSQNVDHSNSIPSSSSEIGKIDYRELAIRMANNYNRPITKKKKRTFVDYVLVFKADDACEINDDQRNSFENALVEKQITVTRTEMGRHVYVELCCSYERLCEEAEALFLQMPLVGLSLHKDESVSKSRWSRAFESEREVDDICIPFCNATKEIYDCVNNPDKFFRPALRSLLVHQILKDIKTDNSDDSKHDNVEALASLIHNGVYEDAFILHERSSLDPNFPLNPSRKKSVEYPSETDLNEVTDRRKDLHMTWLSNFKFQPLWKVRNYFGEKIALYFAWLGLLITSLWIPMLIGFVVFFYGIAQVFISKKTETWSKVAFDNDLTPFFALIICLWGTIFLEVWKRKNAELAYKWDVDDFEDQEPNRPQFYGSKDLKNPLTGQMEPYYSPYVKTFKSMGSMVLIFFMVILVLGSLVSVIVYRIIARVDWFSGTYKVLKSNITSSILNSASIMLLGFLYKYLAKKLTNWENHRTQTQFDDSLILKLFGFQFVNSYSSLYYIAFFRERTKSGVLGLGSLYTDSCGAENNCMSLLSLQVGILMLMKPMPKLFTDIGLPFLRKAFRAIRHSIRRNKIESSTVINENLQSDIEFEDFMDHERKKPSVGDFTLEEYTEKVIQYGYLMLFAAAFPLAPLIALLTNLIDLRIDARRLLWLNQRPIPRRAQDIGMWYTILQLLNYIGVITNAFVISLTSSFGRKYKSQTYSSVYSNSTTVAAANSTINYYTTNTTVTNYQNLWIIIIFENVVLAVRFILACAIPDVPEKVRTAQNKERFEVERVLKKVGMRRGKRKTIAPAISSRPSTAECQLGICMRSREEGGSLKEKIRRISQAHRKSKNNPRDGAANNNKQKAFFIDGNLDNNRHSEV